MMFRPTNSQLTALYGVNPFQRIEISLGPNVDRSNGEYFPSPQGSGMYIERADYPVILSFVNRAIDVGQSIVCADGKQVECFFKGFTLTHPLLNQPTAGAFLSIVTYASDDAVIVNQLATPAVRLPLSARSVTASGVAQQFNIYVPPGVRALNNLQIAGADTTVTGAGVTLQLLDGNNNALIGPTSITRNVAGATVIYNTTNPQYVAQAVLAAGGLSFVANFGKIVLPSVCAEIQVAYAGTGLGAPQFTGWFE